jgi:hypothetical protein
VGPKQSDDRTKRFTAKPATLLKSGLGLVAGAALLIVTFQNCAPMLEPTESASLDLEVSGDSAYRLPASFEGSFNTGISCSVTTNAANISVGGSLVYTISISSGSLPSGARLFAYGTKNGIADASEIVPESYTQTTIALTNPGTIGGTYTRYFQVRDELGRVLCQTNSVQTVLAGNDCTLTTSATSVRVGQAVTLSTAYRNGAAVPTNGRLEFHGTNNGNAIQPIPYTGTNYSSYTHVMTNVDAANEYIRQIVVLDAGGATYCQTNRVRIRVSAQ